ncbi:mitochondrial K+-H+ exchange-related-domain-containing protein [Schizophyllum amplum]|uniref:Mitochondrial K+-H+ exchange-related-domain-containing protein n=1 Tax=Schizophyllum amplum TaxID=97359 RepID=A0A550CH60_9AGAR|nr:mitochondrial K+-H+ exchange-related-domain-containing protein [Auriculariopsis ampla]
MRIVAIPLTRPAGDATLKTAAPRTMLTYYHFQISKPPKSSGKKKADLQGKTERPHWWSQPEEGWKSWVTDKAANTWAGFGKAREGSWQLKTYEYGERLVDRIDFEELALKGIDPSIGPTITHPDVTGSESSGPKVSESITLLYPSSVLSGPGTLAHLKSLIDHRTPRHKKGFIVWMIAAPLTAPFMIIPIIPNLPFFFCVWRSWSHYQAWRASQYLQSLIDSGAIHPEPSEALDILYRSYRPPSREQPTVKEQEGDGKTIVTRANPDVDLLLTKDSVPAILQILNLKPSAEADLYRALEQARLRLKRGEVKKPEA